MTTAQDLPFQLRIGQQFIGWLHMDAVSAVDLAVALRQSPTTAHYHLALEHGEPLLDDRGVPLVPIPGLPGGLPSGLLPTGGISTQPPSAQQAGDWVQQWLGQLHAQAGASSPQPQPTTPTTPWNPWSWWTG